jgi:hypothetical protein
MQEGRKKSKPARRAELERQQARKGKDAFVGARSITIPRPDSTRVVLVAVALVDKHRAKNIEQKMKLTRDTQDSDALILSMQNFGSNPSIVRSSADPIHTHTYPHSVKCTWRRVLGGRGPRNNVRDRVQKLVALWRSVRKGRGVAEVQIGGKHLAIGREQTRRRCEAGAGTGGTAAARAARAAGRRGRVRINHGPGVVRTRMQMQVVTLAVAEAAEAVAVVRAAVTGRQRAYGRGVKVH